MGDSIEWDHAEVDLADDITTIDSVPCLLRGVAVTTGISNHDVPIKDGNGTVFTVPANATAGTFYDLPIIICQSSLIVDPDNAATGNLDLYYRRRRDPR